MSSHVRPASASGGGSDASGDGNGAGNGVGSGDGGLPACMPAWLACLPACLLACLAGWLTFDVILCRSGFCKSCIGGDFECSNALKKVPARSRVGPWTLHAFIMRVFPYVWLEFSGRVRFPTTLRFDGNHKLCVIHDFGTR